MKRREGIVTEDPLEQEPLAWLTEVPVQDPHLRHALSNGQLGGSCAARWSVYRAIYPSHG
jgi:hypothetical protein